MEEEITKARLVQDLTALGVEAGDHIGLAISFKSLGKVKGGPDTLIDSLLEVVGSRGTIMVNTYTPNMRLSDIRLARKSPIFNHRSTPCNTGIVCEKVWRRPNAVRS